MNNFKTFVNASNIHSGGGRTLLLGFFEGLKSINNNFIIYTDVRFKYNIKLPKSVKVIKVNMFTRFLIGFKIYKLATKNDKVLYFGNLPPYLKFKTNDVNLLLSSRFYIDNISMKGFKISQRLKIILEKIYFNIFLNNVSNIIVQTSSMKKLLVEYGFKKKISITAFDDINENNFKKLNNKREKNSFIYVASLLPYKNHKRLVKAWLILQNSGLQPRLYLTYYQKNSIYNWILSFIEKYKLNIVLLENLKRKDLLKKYNSTEVLIYPSLFEAYGLPLVEAKKNNMHIISSDLDYCWDFLHPDDFFNPEDVNSIVRAVQRYLKKTPDLNKIYSPIKFINKLIK